MTRVQKTVGDAVVCVAVAPRRGRCGTIGPAGKCDTKTRVIVIVPCSDVNEGEPGLAAVRVCPYHLEERLPALVAAIGITG